MNPLNRMNPGFRKKDVMSIIGTHVESDRDFARDLDDTLTIIQPGDSPTVYSCSLGDECTRTITCRGLHAFPELKTFKELTREEPYTGNGYSVAINPLLEEPATIDEHVSLIRARGASLERWTYRSNTIAKDGSKIREIIARMEGDLQQLRTLVKDIEQAER